MVALLKLLLPVIPLRPALALFSREDLSLISGATLSGASCFRGTGLWREQDGSKDGECSCRGFQILPRALEPLDLMVSCPPLPTGTHGCACARAHTYSCAHTHSHTPCCKHVRSSPEQRQPGRRAAQLLFAHTSRKWWAQASGWGRAPGSCCNPGDLWWCG